MRERLRASLMLALYRTGRQADALQVYRDGRRVLAGELGLEPGPELQRLERSILAQDPELDGPTPTPPPLPAETATGEPLPLMRTNRRPLVPPRGRSAGFCSSPLASCSAWLPRRHSVSRSRAARPRSPQPSRRPSLPSIRSRTRSLRRSLWARSRSRSRRAEGGVWVGDQRDGTVTEIDPVRPAGREGDRDRSSGGRPRCRRGGRVGRDGQLRHGRAHRPRAGCDCGPGRARRSGQSDRPDGLVRRRG